jgi:hypothetical protein
MTKRYFALLLILAVLGVMPAVAQEQEDANDSATKVVDKMHAAVGQLKKLNTGNPTQKTQKEIIENLDGLIALLEKEADGASGMKNPNARRPMNDSRIGSGPGGMGDLLAARNEGKDWGELPPHERDRILQSMTEGFPPHYQRILERYYKRLAQETLAASDKDETDANKPVATDDKATAPPADAQPAVKPAVSSEKK